MSNAQIFGQISDQNALFLMERGAVGRIIFVVFLLVDSSSSSSSNLFQSQRSLKSQLKQKQSMLTIIFTGNREEAK